MIREKAIGIGGRVGSTQRLLGRDRADKLRDTTGGEVHGELQRLIRPNRPDEISAGYQAICKHLRRAADRLLILRKEKGKVSTRIIGRIIGSSSIDRGEMRVGGGLKWVGETSMGERGIQDRSTYCDEADEQEHPNTRLPGTTR